MPPDEVLAAARICLGDLDRRQLDARRLGGRSLDRLHRIVSLEQVTGRRQQRGDHENVAGDSPHRG